MHKAMNPQLRRNSMKMHCRGVMTALFVVTLLPRLSFAAPEQKTKIAMISFGDAIENKTWIKGWKPNYNTKAKIEESIGKLKEKGYSTIYWRVLWDGASRDQIDMYSMRVEMEAAQLKREFENTPYAWDPYELRWPIEVAHRLGLKFYAWVVPHNMGAPPGAMAEITGPKSTAKSSRLSQWTYL